MYQCIYVSTVDEPCLAYMKINLVLHYNRDFIQWFINEQAWFTCVITDAIRMINKWNQMRGWSSGLNLLFIDEQLFDHYNIYNIHMCECGLFVHIEKWWTWKQTYMSSRLSICYQLVISWMFKFLHHGIKVLKQTQI